MKWFPGRGRQIRLHVSYPNYRKRLGYLPVTPLVLLWYVYVFSDGRAGVRLRISQLHQGLRSFTFFSAQTQDEIRCFYERKKGYQTVSKRPHKRHHNMH